METSPCVVALFPHPIHGGFEYGAGKINGHWSVSGVLGIVRRSCAIKRSFLFNGSQTEQSSRTDFENASCVQQPFSCVLAAEVWELPEKKGGIRLARWSSA